MEQVAVAVGTEKGIGCAEARTTQERGHKQMAGTQDECRNCVCRSGEIVQGHFLPPSERRQIRQAVSLNSAGTDPSKRGKYTSSYLRLDPSTRQFTNSRVTRRKGSG